MSTKPFNSEDLPGSLPPELWLDIMPHLPWQIQKELALTCQSFRHVAQPFLFRRLVFTLPQKMDEEYLEWSSGKISFCSSQMSAAVRKVHLDVPHLRRRHHSDTLYDRLIDQILSSLPNLINLVALECSNIVFAAQHISHLCLKSSLPQLVLDNCSWVLPEHLPNRLHVSALIISTKQNAKDVDGWHDFLESDSVSLNFASTKLGDLIKYPHTVRHMSELDFTLDSQTLPLLAEFLMLQPPLRLLHAVVLTEPDADRNPVTASGITAYSFSSLSSLNSYQGPYELLHVVSNEQCLTQLRKVHLKALAHGGYYPSADAEIIVAHIGEAAPRLEELEFWVGSLTRTVLIAVVGHCTVLKNLEISGGIGENTNSAGFSSVSVGQKMSNISTTS